MSPETSKLEAGAVLDGTYQLTELIGSGGMGTVWQARHLRLPKAVAVKVLRESIDASSEAFLRFRREAEIASQLGHPHIVEALDFNTLADGSPYLVLEYLDGESLRGRLMRGPVPLAITVQLTRQIASALQAAHAKGVVHRDLKPENIFLCHVEGEGVPHAKILDFGISKIHSARTQLTQEGTIFGTPYYMAPEQAAGRPSEPSADQFALAAMVYEMLCGRTAFSGDNAVGVLYQVVHETPPPLASRAPQLPQGVVQAVERGMAKDPAARFPNVISFARELARAAGVEAATPAMGTAALAATLPPTATGPGPAVDSEQDIASAATMASPAPSPPSAPSTTAPPAVATPVTLTESSPAGGPRRRLFLAIIVVAVLAGFGVGIASYLRAVSTDRPLVAPSPDLAAPKLTATRPDLARSADHGTPADAALVDTAHPDLAPRRQHRPHPQAKKRPPATTPVRPELQQEIQRAEQLLASQKLSAVRSLGERLLRNLAPEEKWVGHAILLRFHCVQQQLEAIPVDLSHIPQAHRGAALRFCKRVFPSYAP